jgi:SpoVK/Ycf46/Vps4 family AAA+-type ATPase
MTNSKHMIALLRSHMDGNDDHFYSIALQIAAHEAHLGHGKLAQELRDIVETGRKSGRKEQGKPVLLVQPKGELSGLVEAAYPDTRLTNMVLDVDIEKALKRILTESRQRSLLREHGLSPRRKILLIGRPGSGKTMTAAALAGELKLPLMTVLLDGIITRFLGETASKLRVIFDAMPQTRGVYFFDEFDALGSRRTQGNDVGEIRRVLNSFLQFIEQDTSDSLIVAATNHVELLDPALFRRFDDVIEYNLPDEKIIQRLIKTRLSVFGFKAQSWADINVAAAGLSHAEIVKACQDAAKRVILDSRKSVGQKDLITALTERARTHKQDAQ